MKSSSYSNKGYLNSRQEQIDTEARLSWETGRIKPWMVLEEEYPYSYGYANAAKNFKEGREKFEDTTSRDLVFLNLHGLDPLTLARKSLFKLVNTLFLHSGTRNFP